MKIGILTQSLCRNYGGILQNWALQQTLIRIGCQPVTLKHRGETLKHTIFFGIRDIAAYCVKNIIRHPTRRENKFPWDLSPFRRLRKFAKRHIQQTPYLPVIDIDLLKKHDISTLIIGSDQVWRPKYNEQYLSLMYADCLPDSPVNIFSYAASFGTETWEYSEGETLMAQNAVKKFKSISVREKSGINLCKKYLGRDAVHVLDPTFLLNESDYKKLIPQKLFNRLPSNYAAVYILDLTDQKKVIVNEICKSLGLSPHYFGHPQSDGKNLVSVEYWLAAIMNSSFVITDSFHGTAFSINFHKPFVSLINYDRGADRFNSLLELFGLTNRAIDSLSSFEIGQINSVPINWKNVNTVLSNFKEISIMFLRNNIDQRSILN